MDPRDDVPLPFRYKLDQVIELTAETSTPYTLPKPRSRLEALPLDVRLIIWQRVGFNFKQVPLQLTDTNNRFDSPGTNLTFEWHHYPWHPTCHAEISPRDDHILVGIMAVNTSIRAELLDLLLRNARAAIQYRLSNRRILFYPYDAGPRRTDQRQTRSKS